MRRNCYVGMAFTAFGIGGYALLGTGAQAQQQTNGMPPICRSPAIQVDSKFKYARDLRYICTTSVFTCSMVNAGTTGTSAYGPAVDRCIRDAVREIAPDAEKELAKYEREASRTADEQKAAEQLALAKQKATADEEERAYQTWRTGPNKGACIAGMKARLRINPLSYVISPTTPQERPSVEKPGTPVTVLGQASRGDCHIRVDGTGIAGSIQAFNLVPVD